MISLKTKKDINNYLVAKYNELYDNKIKDVEDILDILSLEFEKRFNILGDAQDAYNEVEDEYSELMNSSDEICFVYNLSGDGNWYVTTGDNFKEENLEKYLNIINKQYKRFSFDPEAKDLGDILALLERQVDKTMCNGGCDMFTALKLILDDDLPELDKKVFVIEGADCEPKIEILY